MEDKILEGILKPTLTLVCPYCEKTHKVSSDIKAKVTECTKCAKKIQIPDNIKELENLLKNIHSMELLNQELLEIKKLTLAQEKEIKVLKAGRNYVGLLPSNYKRLDAILRLLQESIEEIEEEISKCFDAETASEEKQEGEEVEEAPQQEDPEEENE